MQVSFSSILNKNLLNFSQWISNSYHLKGYFIIILFETKQISVFSRIFSQIFDDNSNVGSFGNNKKMRNGQKYQKDKKSPFFGHSERFHKGMKFSILF